MTLLTVMSSFYAHDPRDSRKQAIALSLLGSQGWRAALY